MEHGSSAGFGVAGDWEARRRGPTRTVASHPPSSFSRTGEDARSVISEALAMRSLPTASARCARPRRYPAGGRPFTLKDLAKG